MRTGKVVLEMVKGLGGRLGLPGTMLAHFEYILSAITGLPAYVLEMEYGEPSNGRCKRVQLVFALVAQPLLVVPSLRTH